MRRFWAGFVLAWAIGAAGAEEPVSRIGFGSCYKPEKSTALWQAVETFQPQVWLWLGDNVYADVIDGKFYKKDLPKEAFRLAYDRLGKSEGMATLKSLPPGHMMATWDDHDFGRNDAGRDWERKQEAKRAFWKFWGGEEKADGVYSSRDFGPEGQRIRVILLDTRYNREDPGSDSDPLGSRQWKWLEEAIKKPGANLVILGSSIQVLAAEHRFEKWSNFPKSQARLLQTVSQAGVPVILVSGDRHHAEISRMLAQEKRGVIYDLTSSGLTEKSTIRNEPNPLRVGEVYAGRNFGVVEVDWTMSDPAVRMQIRDEQGNVVLEEVTSLSQLAPPKA